MFSLAFFRRAGLWGLLGFIGFGCSGMERADSFCPPLRVVAQASVLKTTEASFEIVRTDGTCVLDEGLLTVDFTIQLEVRLDSSIVSPENVSVPLFVAVGDSEKEVIHRKWISPVSVEPVRTRRAGSQTRLMQHRVKTRWLLGSEEKPSQFAFYLGLLEPELN